MNASPGPWSCSRICRFATAVAVLSACAREHAGSESQPKPRTEQAGATAAAAGAAAVSGKAGSASSDSKSVPGTRAVANLERLGDVADDGTLYGVAKFNVTTSGVDLSLNTFNCGMGKAIQLYVQEGRDCSPETIAGERWDGARGAGVPVVTCLTINNIGRLAYSRPNEDKKPWSIGGSPASDLLGHALVAYDANSGTPLACGVVMRADEPVVSPPTKTSPSKTPLAQRAVIAGMCVANIIVRDNLQKCPDPKALTACADEHCNLEACVQKCANYLACTAQAEDPCSVAATCEVDDACGTCNSEVVQCGFMFCADVIACAAPPTPGGPCSQLEACCAQQGDEAMSCLSTVQLLAKLSGDASCLGAIHDWDFFSHLPVPCTFQ